MKESLNIVFRVVVVSACMILESQAIDAGQANASANDVAQSKIEERLDIVEKDVSEINVRLGREKQKPSSMYNIEKRIEEIEKQVEKINDSLRRIEQRVEKVERRKN